MMKKIQFYTDKGEQTVEFGFNNPEITYRENPGWTIINASGRTITLSGTSMLAFDEDISNNRVLLDWSSFWKNEMNDAYGNNERILVVFSSGQVPVMMFHGNALKFVENVKELTYFLMDDKPIWLYHMNYLILAKK